MATKTLTELPQSEQDDFSFACAEHGLTTEQFHICAEELYPVIGVKQIQREVHVQRISNNVRREYPADSGMSWTMAFGDDLLSGEFD